MRDASAHRPIPHLASRIPLQSASASKFSTPGVQTTCGRGSCAIMMTRSARGCRPEYYLDGFPASFSVGPDFQITGAYGIEVYRTASEAPAEFRKPELRCGVILIWSDMSQ